MIQIKKKHEFYRLNGSWQAGIAYDVHTLSSSYLGVDEYGNDRYKNIRSIMGELVYRLKYMHDDSATKEIIDLLNRANLIESIIEVSDIIIPIPPTKNRALQPVYEIACELSNKTNLPLIDDLLYKTANKELKGITDPIERQKELQNTMKITDFYDLSGKNVLLIDDLYRSGATLTAATNLLYSEANLKNVYVLTMTKTRSNR